MATKRNTPTVHPGVRGRRAAVEHGLTVQQLITRLEKCPPLARVYFLDTDDPCSSACYVSDAMPVPKFQKSLGHADAEATVRDAGLRDQYVVVTGVNVPAIQGEGGR